MASQEKGKNKVKWGLSFRIMLVVFVTGMFACLIFMSMTMTQTNTMLSQSVENSIMSLVKTNGAALDREEGQGYEKILADVKVEGYESGYAYLVDVSGTMLYHPTKDKIGKPVENTVVKGIVKDLEDGKEVTPTVITYEFKGAQKYAGYYVSPTTKNILVVTLDKDEVFAPVDKLKTRCLLTMVFIVLVSMGVTLFTGRAMSKPLKQLAEVALAISKFDLRDSEMNRKIAKRSDEAGIIARAMMEMRTQLHKVVNGITRSADNLHENAVSIQTGAININEYSHDNSATTEELAAGMEETSATTTNIDATIRHISQDTNDIAQLTKQGEELATNIMERAKELTESSQRAKANTDVVYQEVKEKTEKAIEQSKAVDKISVLAEAIRSIAEQTSLLSLNASIEAARAGEQGKGFAVVAGEIGKLATQSTESVNDITNIVSEVYKAVENMTKCLNDTIVFLERDVSANYEGFIQVSEKYRDDASDIDGKMQTISQSTENLKLAIDDIEKAIEGINVTIFESTKGVTDIADKTSDTVQMTSSTIETVNDNLSEAGEIHKIVDLFSLDAVE